MILNSFNIEAPRLFVGLEVEQTCFFGKATLFIAGDVPVEDIQQALAKRPMIRHLYFGAGGLTKINIDTVNFFRERAYSTTLEAVCTPTQLADLKPPLDFAHAAIVLPVTNNGVYYKDVVPSLPLWFAAAQWFLSTSVYVKIDSADPHVCIIPLSTLVQGYNAPEAYAGDVQL